MDLLAIVSGEPITWGDLLIVLGVLALFIVIFNWFPRRRP